jgi:hypothetical protein
MNKFLSKLKVEVTGEQSFILLEPLIYKREDYTIIVHTGFDFDGASIPRLLWSIAGCPMGGLYSAPACIHDALYASKIFDKKTCDKIFHEAMLVAGVNRQLAKEMYLAVRAFGSSAYEEAEDIQKYRNLIEIKGDW